MPKTRSDRGAADPDLLSAALLGYEQQRSAIVDKIAELRRQLGRRGAANGVAIPADAVRVPVRKKRTLSAVARNRIAAAQRKRWAALRKESKPAASPAAKPKMSAAAKARIAEAARRRWAAFRAKKAQAGAAPKTKTAGE
jgi:hypothetical protein